MHKARVSELLGKVMAAEEASHISNGIDPLGLILFMTFAKAQRMRDIALRVLPLGAG